MQKSAGKKKGANGSCLLFQKKSVSPHVTDGARFSERRATALIAFIRNLHAKSSTPFQRLGETNEEEANCRANGSKQSKV